MKKFHSNDTLLGKITSSSHHMKQTTFIEATCIYNIDIEGLWVVYIGADQKLEVYFGRGESPFTFIGKRRPNKYCLCEVNLISYMQVFSLMDQAVNLARKIEV